MSKNNYSKNGNKNNIYGRYTPPNIKGLSQVQKDVNLAQPIIDLFDLYRSGQAANWKADAANDIEFVNNAQWEESIAMSLEDANQPVLTNNEMKPTRDQVVQQLTDNDPRWWAIPRENSDTKLAGDISDLASYIWDKSNGNMHFRKAVEDLEDTGLFVMYTYYDPFADSGKGEMKVIRINPQDIYLDPRCTWRNAQDSNHIFLGTILSERDIALQYPNYDFRGAQSYEYDMRTYGVNHIGDGQIFQPMFMREQNYYRVIDCYTKIKVDMFWVYDPNSNFEATLDKKGYKEFAKKPAIILTQRGREKAITEDIEVKKYLSIIQQYGNLFYQNTDGSISAGVEPQQSQVSPDGRMLTPIPNSTTKAHIVTMNDLLYQGMIKWQIAPVDRIQRDLVIGEKLYRRMTLPITKYPFGITMLHHTDTPYPYGDARLCRSIQEQINKINSIIVAYNINITNVKAFIPKDSGLRKEMELRWGKAGAQFFEFDPDTGQPPIIVQLTQMSNSFYMQLDRLKLLIQRIYGAYEFQDGQPMQAPMTASGTSQMDEIGLRRSKAKLDLIESALNDLGDVISQYIPNVYTERKLIRILKPNGSSKSIVFNDETQNEDIAKIANDLTSNRYDLQVQSGSTLPSTRAARFAALLRLYELKVIKNPAPILRQTDLPDIDEILQGEDVIQQQQQFIGQLNQNIKMLHGNLITKTREKLHADEQVQLAKTKARLDALVAQASAGVQLGKQRVSDEVKSFKQKADEALGNINNTNSKNADNAGLQGDVNNG